MFGKEFNCGQSKHGDEIRLITPRRENVPLLVEWLNDHEVMRLLDPHAKQTNEKQEALHLREFESSDEWCMWQIEVDSQCIGAAWLHDIQYPEATAFTGIMIGDKNYWGHGIGTVVEEAVINYAFSELKLEYLYAIIFAPNIASRQVFEKLGFKQYGIKPAAAFIDGKLYDGWEAYLSKKDWETRR